MDIIINCKLFFYFLFKLNSLKKIKIRKEKKRNFFILIANFCILLILGLLLVKPESRLYDNMIEVHKSNNQNLN